ncbi:MAG: leucine-rich repeat protein, partial [Clostridia bacterium]|nr:leucine-rich repeat protein [Clostridia bacterium]
MEKVNGVLLSVQDEDLYLLKKNPTEFWKDVTSIGEEAFAGRDTLMTIEIPDGVTSIGRKAFADCLDLTNVKIPDSVTSIGEEAFDYCESLKTIKIPNGVTTIEKDTFFVCRSLNDIRIPNSVKNFGEGAFSFCKSLTNIKIPNGQTCIGDYTFNGCESLTNIKIPNSVTSIGECAFGYCRSLTNIEIPNSVTSIGNEAFIEVQKLNVQNKSICGDLLHSKIFEMIKNNPRVNLKQLHAIYDLAQEQGIESNNVRELVAMSVNLGMLEPKTTVIETGKDKAGKPIMSPVNNIVYTFMQGIIKSNQINLNELHMH